MSLLLDVDSTDHLWLTYPFLSGLLSISHVKKIWCLPVFWGFGGWKVELELRDDCRPYLGAHGISGRLSWVDIERNSGTSFDQLFLVFCESWVEKGSEG